VILRITTCQSNIEVAKLILLNDKLDVEVFMLFQSPNKNRWSNFYQDSWLFQKVQGEA